MIQPKYTIYIQWSPIDQLYIAKIPEFKMCTAYGDTHEEAFENGMKAMQDAIDKLIANSSVDELPLPYDYGNYKFVPFYEIQYLQSFVDRLMGKEEK